MRATKIGVLITIQGVLSLFVIYQLLLTLPTVTWLLQPSAVTASMMIFLCFKLLLIGGCGFIVVKLHRKISGDS
jgi:hypothetical protein